MRLLNIVSKINIAMSYTMWSRFGFAEVKDMQIRLLPDLLVEKTSSKLLDHMIAKCAHPKYIQSLFVTCMAW